MSPPTGKPVFLVVAGPNGSGKTTFAGKNSVGTRIDPDAIAKQIRLKAPESTGMTVGRAARQMIKEHIEQGKSFTVETTFSGQQAMRDMEAARAAGFIVKMEFIGIGSAALSAARVADRVLEGGHSIPAEDIARRFDKVMDNLARVSPLVDELIIRDNGSRNFRLIARVKNGQIIHQANRIPGYLEKAIFEIDGHASSQGG
ncbi:MAG: hypothetical protein E5Y74_12070 [Mesorhizobium sp.]|uniref:zeta toxin family protein n=1 Tax=unclassified Mesorhizobium TaxID=325217 RepID=UPI000FCC6FFA|nr:MULTISPECIES: zeta toxin family protein [unclassified Mesorhizobium]RUU91427.1 hypothetical protein EOB59_12110 [Mesorhizobium sp. M7A.F.Ca.MR.176.00.0.0]RVD65791.1 hypothetical protein EN750_06450 [Mesorhizobium sp. M7A.F.Ca.ET.027.03.2.1]TIM21906.1 MAG: hypothetical protein E5Y74_12070 [Mesorhizobium sp.]